MNAYRKQSSGVQNRQGFTLLIAILVVGVILAIGLSILTITLKEFLLSNIARESVIALNAADAGLECALYWDRSSQGGKFNIGAPVRTISDFCMDKTVTVGDGMSGTEQVLTEVGGGTVGITWGSSPNPSVCAIVSVTKYHHPTVEVIMDDGIPCPAGITCTRVVSRGYNKSCGNLTAPGAVERALRARY